MQKRCPECTGPTELKYLGPRSQGHSYRVCFSCKGTQASDDKTRAWIMAAKRLKSPYAL